MYIIFKNIHHYVAMATLLFILLYVIVAFIYYLQGRNISSQLRKISLFTLIFTHTQVILGIILFFSSPIFQNNSMKDIMKTSAIRQNYVEHPFSMLIVAILVTVVNAKIKRAAKVSFANLLMVVIALALVIGMIPRTFWSTLIP